VTYPHVCQDLVVIDRSAETIGASSIIHLDNVRQHGSSDRDEPFGNTSFLRRPENFELQISMANRGDAEFRPSARTTAGSIESLAASNNDA
jgi:hypothetical protein